MGWLTCKLPLRDRQDILTVGFRLYGCPLKNVIFIKVFSGLLIFHW